MALLDELEKINKRNGVTKVHLVPDEDMESYVRSQITEMRQIIARDRVDVLLNEQIPVEGKQEREGRDAKIRELEGRIAQMVEAVNVLSKLLDEIE